MRIVNNQEVCTTARDCSTYTSCKILSTLLGFPNPLGTSFPAFLQVMLEDAYPRRRFKVVNCGITAINSFVLLDFVDEIVAYEPDLVIIYAGHNDQGYYFFHHLGLDRNMRDDFRGHPYWKDCAEFCEKYDQNSFDPGYETFPLPHFESLVRKVFAEPRKSIYRSEEPARTASG